MKKQELEVKLSGLERIKNNKFSGSITMIELANKGFELYKLANIDEKREMLKIVFPTSLLTAKSLV